MRFATGHSDDVDADVAALEATEQALAHLDAAEPKAVLVFTGIDVDTRAAVRAIATRLPTVPLVGGTSAAEASRQLGSVESSVLVLLLSGDDLEVGVGLGRATGGEVDAPAVEAIARARAALRSEPSLCISFTTFNRNPSAPLDAVVSALETPSIPVFGGAAACEYGDAIRTEVFFGSEVYDEAFIVLLLGGSVRHAHAVASGWIPVGKTHTVTRVQERNLLVEIDGTPAIEIYRNYLGLPGGFGAMFVHHPLAVACEGGVLQRVAYGAGPLPGSLLMAGNIEEGALVRLSEFDRESVIEATREATSKALSSWGGGAPSVALVVECASRRFALGTRMQRAAEVVRDTLPPTTQVVGMHALGEFAPLSPEHPSVVQNCSIVVLLLGAP